MEILNSIHMVLVGIVLIVVIIVLGYLLYSNVFEKDGQEPKGCGWKFILCVIVVLGVLMLISMCGGDGGPLEIRMHTD